MLHASSYLAQCTRRRSTSPNVLALKSRNCLTRPLEPLYANSPVHVIKLGKNHQVSVKRDDLLGPNPGMSGNKVRKLAFLQNLLGARPHSYHRIVSWGGNQSNAMLAIANFAQQHGLQFDYYTPPVPKQLLLEPEGNFGASLQLGMRPHESSDIIQDVKRFLEQHDPISVLYIPRGVEMPEAEQGIVQLAKEIHEDWKKAAENKNLLVYLPTGTGTTAAYLQKHLKTLTHGTPYTASVVGVSVALKPDDLADELLNRKDLSILPEDLPRFVHPSKKRIRFAQVDASVKAVWCTMKRKGLELDLIYGPVAWMALLESLPSIDSHTTAIYYIHTGGMSGNESQLKRYGQDACKVS